jgi:hypothetical protein
VEKLLRDFPDNVLSPETHGEEFIQALESRVVRDVDAGAAPDFIYMRYEKEEGTYCLLFNTSREESFEPEAITLYDSGNAYLVDTEKGEVTALKMLPTEESGQTKVHLAFAPQQSRVVLISESELDAPPATQVQKTGLQPIEFGDKWTFRLDSDNYLPLAEWSMNTENSHDARDWVKYHHNFETTFHVKDVPDSLHLLADGIMRQERWRGYGISPAEIEVNGQKVEKFGEGSHYDRLVPEAEIAHLIKPGENRVRVHTTGGLAEAAVLRQPLVLAGRFALETEGAKQVIVSPRATQTTGSWAEQGYPFFSGSASYEQTLTIPDEYTGKPLRLIFDGVADIVDVRVNGQQAGVRAWAPWEVPVGDLVKAGENKFTFKVTNSLYNLFIREPRASGLVGPVHLAAY